VSQPGDAGSADIVRVDTGTWQVRREKLLENFANVGSLSSQATVTPYFVQGQQLGFRLSRLRAGGVLQQIGLQEGDVLQQVNGLDIHTPQEALQAYQQLQTESSVRLSILRNNSPTTLTYEIR
jgi:general secretion pathway protein C